MKTLLLIFLFLVPGIGQLIGQVGSNPVISNDKLSEHDSLIRTPVLFALEERIHDQAQKSRDGLMGDTVEIPFYVENTLRISHPGLHVKGGIPLPIGVVEKDDAVNVFDETGKKIEAQVTETAYWPDGSLKWLLVIMKVPVNANCKEWYLLRIEKHSAGSETSGIILTESEESLFVDTGKISFEVANSGRNLLKNVAIIDQGERITILDDNGGLDLFAEIERVVDQEHPAKIAYHTSTLGSIESVDVEEFGKERVVIRIRGRHLSESNDAFAPFCLRIFAYANSARIKFQHFFVFDGNPETDFLRSIGVKLHTNALKVDCFSLGSEFGSGHIIPYEPSSSLPEWATAVVMQNSSTSYSIKKWVDPTMNSAVRMEDGEKSLGWGSLGGGDIGVTIGLKNFWQEYPKAIQANAKDRELIAYIYSPFAERLDLRRYSDKTYPEVYETSRSKSKVDIAGFTQEWEGFARESDIGAKYIGKTSEFFVDFALKAKKSDSVLSALFFQTPPILGTPPKWIARTRVFGDFAPLDDEYKQQFGEMQKSTINFLINEQAYRKWYGFLDYGDVMHSFDIGRDVWRRDQGGYAWNNNEHMISEGIWSAYLHTGDPELFRFAEAMTRHVGDIDMYHDGSLAGHGSRHNINHYGSIGKKRRMTIPENKRIYYYLSGDRHTADLIWFIYDSFTQNEIELQAKSVERNAMDLGVFASALLFLWETTNQSKYGELLKDTTESICAYPVNGRGFTRFLKFDPHSGRTEPGLNPMISQPVFFLLKFGPMDMLLNTVELTRSHKVHEAILKWAELFHLPVEEAKKYQNNYFPRQSYGRALTYAYTYTGNAAYRKFLSDSFDSPPLWFQNVGGDGPLDKQQHLVPRSERIRPDIGVKDGPEEILHVMEIADFFRNGPYVWKVLSENPVSPN